MAYKTGAFERLAPPWENLEIVERTGTIRDGDTVVFRMKTGPFGMNWRAVHSGYQEGREFTDTQASGPFSHWKHTHRIVPDRDHSILEDNIEYALPGGMLGNWIAGSMVRETLAKVFRYRHIITTLDIESHRTGGTPMNVAITGASGLIGSILVPYLTTGGHTVKKLVRHTSSAKDEIQWDPNGKVDTKGLEGIDAVVHLAGEGIAQRWTPELKKRILESRSRGTRTLCEALAALENPPKVLVTASAIGYYGDRGAELLTEDSAPGQGFLPDVCVEWEKATAAASERGIRVVNLRIGIVLHPRGGALSKMLLPFKAGVGGRMGSGQQYWSWVAMDDVIGAIHHALVNDTIQGPVNATAPNPVTNAEFTKTLARVLHRPAIFPVPAIAIRVALGGMADELLLASGRVHPAKLIASQYEFRYPELTGALRHLL